AAANRSSVRLSTRLRAALQSLGGGDILLLAIEDENFGGNTMKLGRILLVVSFAGIASAQTDYDLLIKGGHVIDGKNRLSAVRDVAIKGDKIAAVAANIPASRALKTVDAAGLYVTPGLIDLHVHVYPGPVRNSYANGSLSLQPDGFTLRNGVNTVADAGSAGWRTFEDFKTRII